MGLAELRTVLAFGGLGLLLAIEQIAPFRRPVQTRLPRYFVNFTIAGSNALLINVLFGSFLFGWSQQVTEQGLGVFNLLGLEMPANIVCSVIVLDLIFYGVHWANHKAPFLWRLHRAHHSDLDLDVTTAVRFHLGEVTLSTAYKIGFIWILGIAPLGLVAFESTLLLAAQVQHSNIRIPEPFETIVRWVFVTPNMHRIHHSQEGKELNSNFSTIFSWWDRLIGTYYMEVRQERIIIGLKDYPEAWLVTLWRVLWIPFGKACKA